MLNNQVYQKKTKILNLRKRN